MIEYHYQEEQIVALHFADILQDEIAKAILTKGDVASPQEARHLSQFFWRMINHSSQENVELPCKGSAEYWTEKLYHSLGAFLHNRGFGAVWDEEIDNA